MTDKKDTISLGLVDTNELRHIFDALMMLRMESKNISGIIVYCDGGRRQWLISVDSYTIVITGDSASFGGAYKLPLTIVANAGRHRAASGATTFTISDGIVTAQSSYGSQSIPCSSVPMPTPERTALTGSRASAQLGGNEFLKVIFSGTGTPFEVGMSDDDGDECTSPEHFMIEIEKDLLRVSSDWSDANLYPMRAVTTADTKGVGQVKVHKDLMPIIFNCVDEESTWTISFDPKQPHDIVLESDTHYIVAKMTFVPVLKLHERAVKVLEREKFQFKTAADGTIGVRHDAITISLDFFQRESDKVPLVRLSTVVTRDANESAELLREINEHNQAGSITRLWFANDAVHLAVDLPPDNLMVLAARLRHLANEAKRLQGVLEPFAAEAALAPRRRRASPRAKRQPEIWKE